MKVSKKGQIVIPANYRDRLGIDPGMEVTVRIRGQFLIVEVDTDIESDMNFLQEIKEQLGEKEIDMNSIEDIISDLLKQQFYAGNNVLTDRIGEETITIRGSDTIIKESIKILASVSKKWLEGDYIETIRGFAEALDLDFPALLSNYVNKVKSMIPGGDTSMIREMGGEIPFSMAVASALTLFREKVGDMVTERIVKQAEERGYIRRLGEDTLEDITTRGLAARYSILMNLRTLRELARTSVKLVGQRKFNSIADEMLDKFDDLDTPEKVIRRRERRLRRRIKKARDSGREYNKSDLEKEVGLDAIKRQSKQEDDFKDEEDLPDQPELPSFDF